MKKLTFPARLNYLLLSAMVLLFGIPSAKAGPGKAGPGKASAPASAFVMTVTISGSPVCPSSNASFSAVVSGGTGTLTYSWKKNGSTVTGITGPPPQILVINWGTFNFGDVITCVVNSSTGQNATSNAVTITQATSTALSVAVNPQNGISFCSGATVNFAASSNGSVSSYQWSVNGSTVAGATSSTFSTTANSVAWLKSVAVSITGSAGGCSSGTSNASATASNIPFTVTTSVTPSVSISSSAGTSICSGASVTFTATPTNGGSTPGYQWQSNGTAISGATGSTYTTSSLTNGQQITCVLTNSSGCATPASVTSNILTMTVTAPTTMSATITGSTSVCSGSSGSWSASVTNPSGTLTYQWKKNGTNVTGQAGPPPQVLVLSTVSNNDVISCVVSSSTACVAPVTSNSVTVTIPSPTTLTATPIPAGGVVNFCQGAAANFNVSTNGTLTGYQWSVNGSPVAGATASTFSTPANSTAWLQSVSVSVTGSAGACPANTTASGSATGIPFVVNPVVTPTANITSSASTICTGQLVAFNATTTNAGTSPQYQWRLNGASISGATGLSYSTSTLTNGQHIDFVLTSSAVCPSSTTATSNAISFTVNPTVGTPSAITGPTTTINQGTTVYTSTASGATSYNWTLTPASAGIISNTGTVTWNDMGPGGPATISVSANGCNGPSSIVTLAITLGCDQNYVRQRTFTQPGIADLTTAAAVTDPASVKQNTQYVDGLGRLVQTVSKQANPQGKDLVSLLAYDAYGRETTRYLPYVSTVSDGNYRCDPITEQNSFNTTQFPGEQYYYGKVDYEASPLDRATKTYAAGSSWVGSSRGVENQYWFNTATDDVKQWVVTDVANNWGTYATTASYAAGTLYKEITYDENGNQSIEFTDLQGHPILKKLRLTATADNGAGSSHAGWLCTYYIYDDLQRLRAVLQPKAVEGLQTHTWNINYDPALLNELCFRYEYDGRDRVIMKKVPGEGETDMVYDQRERLVMSQDANLRAQGKWLVTEYDNSLNLVLRTGLLVDANSRATHQGLAANSIAYPSVASGYTVLTEAFYDTYAWLATNGNPLGNTYSTAFDTYLQPVAAVYPYPQANTPALQTKGMVTGTRALVMGTSTYIYTASFYDTKGRVIQTAATNITGGKEIATTQYGWAGQTIMHVDQQATAGTNAQTSLTLTRMTYDAAGRLVKTEKKAGNSLLNAGALPTAWLTISEEQYDALGQLAIKTVGKLKGTDHNYTSTPVETLNYSYNIRGWLTGINKGYINRNSTTPAKFGFELAYDKRSSATDNYTNTATYAATQFNGNITGMVWRSAGDGENRKYDFAYDVVNRLTGADFNQYTANVYSKTGGVDFSLSNLSYDANGNILSMSQKGLKVAGSNFVDQLKYDYIGNSNRLLNVTDFSNDATGKLGDFKTATSHPQASAKSALTPTSTQAQFDAITDYTYDVNGNILTDNNKAVANITYNYLNLPQQITIAGKGTITYSYDGGGNKLQKVVSELASATNNNTATVTTSTYIGGAVYESKTVNGVVQYTNRLQFSPQEEGRIRPLYTNDATPNTPTGLAYDYFIKDHLGNVRMTLTDQQQTDIYPAATLEGTGAGTDPIVIEKNYYNIADANVVSKSVATGITSYPNNNGNPPPNNNPNCNDVSVIKQTDLSQKLYQLNGNTAKTGLGITLKVMAGDYIDIFGKSYYFTNNTGGTSVNSAVPVLEVLTGLLAGSAASAAHEAVTPSQLNGLAGTTAGITSLLNSETTDIANVPTTPKAYINYLFFDEQFKCVGGSFSRVGGNSTVKDHHTDLQNIAVPKNGYVYIYCSNESPVNVYFDNLQVVHTRGAILDETHYYPFGLAMTGISSKALGFGGAENKFKYNGKELQSKEFSDGSGLDWTDFGARMYDAQIGRWHAIDPMSDNMRRYSPYNYAFDDPIGFIDPDGMMPAGFVDINDPDWAEKTRPGENPWYESRMEDEARDADKKKDDDKKTKEIARIITAIAMGEGAHGDTFSNDDLILIGSVYINILKSHAPFSRSFVYVDRNKPNSIGQMYRMYMYALGSPDYAKNKAAKTLASSKHGSELAARAKEIYKTFYRALTDKTYTNAVLSHPGMVNQGYWGDLNKASNPMWNLLGWYRMYESGGINDMKGNPIKGTVIAIWGNDPGHKNATFLIDGNAAERWLRALSCGIDWFNQHSAPKLDPATQSYSVPQWPTAPTPVKQK